jgi:hypothetical protein
VLLCFKKKKKTQPLCHDLVRTLPATEQLWNGISHSRHPAISTDRGRSRNQWLLVARDFCQ